MAKNNGKYIIGVTGGVGTGKSYISGYICGRYNGTLISADEIAKESYEKGGECYNAMIEAFGEDILDRNKDIDRPYLARLVFSDALLRNRLNGIIHPYVYRRVQNKISISDGLIVFEAALPKEAHMQELCDEVWFVRASMETRIERLMKNRGYTRDRSEKMVASQLTDGEYRALANVVIKNDGDLFAPISQVDQEMTRVIIADGGNII